MKKIFTRNNILRSLLFAAAAAIVLFIMPGAESGRYEYALGKPWTYQLLTAPVDMPVYLDTITAQHVRDSITHAFVPVYTRDTNAEKSALAAYATRVNSNSEIDLDPNERNALIGALRKLLDDGVVDQETYREVRTGQLTEVRFIRDNTAITIPTTNFRSARAAYASLDSVFPQPHFRKAIEITALSKFLPPTISIDSAASQRLFEELLQKAMAPIGVIQQGERIIDKGDVVTPELYTLLRTYDRLSGDKSQRKVDAHHYPMLGRLLYIILILGSLYLYLAFFRRNIFSDIRSMVLIMALLVGVAVIAFAMAETFRAGLYMMPFTVVAVMMTVFFDTRTAFFIFLMEIMICAMIAVMPLEFIYMQLVAGVVAITSLRELDRRSQLVRAALFIYLAYSLSYVAVEVMQVGTIEKINVRMFGWLGINAVLISFAYVLVFIIEKLFGLTSAVTLVELSDVNHSVLRELSEGCPGTFQHSMQVSSLASEAARRIGANVQLVRTGALYHDIGKINNPAFFTENQHGVNPHDALNAVQSARIVINHVTDGLRRAEKAKLPQVIKDFISEHHGAGKAKYFYNTWANAHPGENIDSAPFTYPGPNPQSRETSVLMMADAVEAASRSLKEYTTESITGLVNRIIDGQIADGLHNESPISFRDVKIIKEAFIERLRTMYHARVSYPELNNQPK